MRIYNNDGSEPEMCGNGIRCFAQFLKDLGADGEIFTMHNFIANLISYYVIYLISTFHVSSFVIITQPNPIE